LISGRARACPRRVHIRAKRVACSRRRGPARRSRGAPVVLGCSRPSLDYRNCSSIASKLTQPLPRPRTSESRRTRANKTPSEWTEGDSHALYWPSPVTTRHLTTDQKVRGSSPFGRTYFGSELRKRSSGLFLCADTYAADGLGGAVVVMLIQTGETRRDGTASAHPFGRSIRLSSSIGCRGAEADAARAGGGGSCRRRIDRLSHLADLGGDDRDAGSGGRPDRLGGDNGRHQRVFVVNGSGYLVGSRANSTSSTASGPLTSPVSPGTPATSRRTAPTTTFPLPSSRHANHDAEPWAPPVRGRLGCLLTSLVVLASTGASATSH